MSLTYVKCPKCQCRTLTRDTEKFEQCGLCDGEENAQRSKMADESRKIDRAVDSAWEKFVP